jgi:hypothetical protein
MNQEQLLGLETLLKHLLTEDNAVRGKAEAAIYKALDTQADVLVFGLVTLLRQSASQEVRSTRS